MAAAIPRRLISLNSRPTLARFAPTNYDFKLRQASTSARTSSSARSIAYSTIFLIGTAAGLVYVTDTRAAIHQYIIPPLIQLLYPDAEDAHVATISALKELYTLGLHPRERGESNHNLTTALLGHTLTNPLGISGGLDKHGELPDALFALGAAIVEIGGVTPRPQAGNARPRVFRIASHDSIVNRYGLPSEGADVVALRLRLRLRDFVRAAGYGVDEQAEQAVLDGAAGVPPGSLLRGRLLAVQIAKNKDTSDDIEDVVADHVYCVERLGKYADILVVNVSSPNTPGLRSLQAKSSLTRILDATVKTARAIPRKSKPLVMVKVSPDEDSQNQIQGICDAVWTSGVDGVIVGNTTRLRPEVSLSSPLPAKEAAALREQGGFSGPQLFDRTKFLIDAYRKTLDAGSTGSEKKVIFASGGITNGQQAKETIEAGASVAMIYTALSYGGAGTISRIKDEMR